MLYSFFLFCFFFLNKNLYKLYKLNIKIHIKKFKLYIIYEPTCPAYYNKIIVLVLFKILKKPLLNNLFKFYELIFCYAGNILASSLIENVAILCNGNSSHLTIQV